MTYKVHYSRLAGPYYAGLDSKYKTDKSNLNNSLYTFAVPAAHPEFDNTTEASGPPQNTRVSKTGTVTNQDGSIVSSAVVSTTYREPFHSFKYYESLGSIYGYHNIIMDRKEASTHLYTREKWQTEPVYIERIDSLNIESPSQLDSTISNCAMTFHAKLNPDSSIGLDLDFDNITVDQDGQKYLDIFIGEYHLLPNTPRSVYRSNISWDIHPVIGPKQNKNRLGESSCLVDGQSLKDLLEKNHVDTDISRESKLSKDPISPAFSNFIEYYAGIAKVPGISSRPKQMQNGNVSMRHPMYLEAGAQLRWKSLKERCSSWMRIYDGTDFKDILSIDAYRPGHYVFNTKIRVNIDKLKIYLEHLNQDVQEKVEWKIILWLPWFSVLGHDTIEGVEYPKLSTFIESFDQVEFKVPSNYKSGGSFHFTIKIYAADKETLLYSESSNSSIPSYYNSNVFYSSIRPGRWYIAYGDEEFEEVGRQNIRFNSDFEEGHGVNHEETGRIKYIPSNELSAYINSTQNLHMQIVTHDGTLKSDSEIVMKYI